MGLYAILGGIDLDVAVRMVLADNGKGQAIENMSSGTERSRDDEKSVNRD